LRPHVDGKRAGRITGEPPRRGRRLSARTGATTRLQPDRRGRTITPLSRTVHAGELELARSVRSGRGFAVLVFDVTAGSGRRGRARRRAVARGEHLLCQHVRAFDTVVADPAAGRLVVLAAEVEARDLAAVERRLATALEGATDDVRSAAVRFPDDGSALRPLLEVADAQLRAQPAATPLAEVTR
jgi:hypothetical protein